MERTVPSTASEEIDLYQRTYYSLLRSTAEVQIRTLEEAHARMKSLLHTEERGLAPDMSAFVYCLLRLPTCMPSAQLVVLGQSPGVFIRGGFGNVEDWKIVSSPARRRRCLFNGRDTLACYIASRSDIDDMIPMLTAYQIEWNKLHLLLNQLPASISLEQPLQAESTAALAGALKITAEDLAQLQVIWGSRFYENLAAIRSRRSNLRVRLLSGSLSEYWRATRIWWENIERSFPNLSDRPVYFVSSNPHSMVNLVSGYALSRVDDLVAYLHLPENTALLEEWNKIVSDPVSPGRENFLYYVMKKFQRVQDGTGFDNSLLSHEQSCGIQRISSEHSFDVEAQVIELAGLQLDGMDPRIAGNLNFLEGSDALILNIDYPLGLAAYNILSKVAEHAGEVLGVYVTGKAATLNGVIGDVMVPNVVHDEQSRNTYLFPNVFFRGRNLPLFDLRDSARQSESG